MNIANIVTRAKLLLQLNDNAMDNLLTEIASIMVDYAKVYLGVDDVSTIPESLFVECVVVRYNRIGSEGVNRETVDKVTFDYEDFEKSFGRLFNRFKRLKTL